MAALVSALGPNGERVALRCNGALVYEGDLVPEHNTARVVSLGYTPGVHPDTGVSGWFVVLAFDSFGGLGYPWSLRSVPSLRLCAVI